MSKLAKIPSLKIGRDEETARHLLSLFDEAQNGLRRIVALGLFCFEIKAQLGHGQFGPWLKAHAPALCRDGNGILKPSSALSNYMQLTAGVLTKCKTSVKSYLSRISNSHQMGICRGGELLLLPDARVPEEARPLREKICSIIDGKTQDQLFFEFKQADEEDRPKRGRRKGEGGATHAQRERVKELNEQTRRENIEHEAKDFSKWIYEVSEANGLPIALKDKTWADLREAVQYLSRFIKGVDEGRSAAKKGGAQ